MSFIQTEGAEGRLRTVVEVGPPDDHGELHGICTDVGVHAVVACEVLGVGFHVLANRLIQAVKDLRGGPNVNKNLASHAWTDCVR